MSEMLFIGRCRSVAELREVNCDGMSGRQSKRFLAISWSFSSNSSDT
jgi:hypothetical protein